MCKLIVHALLRKCKDKATDVACMAPQKRLEALVETDRIALRRVKIEMFSHLVTFVPVAL